MSFNFGATGGASAPKTTGSGFSFPTLTTSTAGGGGTSGGGFTFGASLAPQTQAAASPFSFGTTSTAATTASAAGGLFSTPTATSQAPASTSSLFSATPSSSAATTFNFSAPAATTASGGFPMFQLPTSTPAPTAAPAAAPTAAPMAAPTAAPAAGPTIQFGGPTKPQGTAPEPAKSAAPSLQGAGFFSTKPTGSILLGPCFTTTTTTAATTTTTPAATSSGFPTLLTGQTSAPSTTTAATTTTATLGLAAATAAITTSAVSLPTSTPILASLTTATSTSSSSVAPAPGAAAAGAGLSVAGLEEKVNKWMSELREQEERLMRQAAHVNAWDQLLQQGHDQVQQLRVTLNNVKADQNRLQAELDFIQGQQQELEQLIEPLEAAASSTTPAQHQGDRQRENMHLVAQNLDSQLRQITDDLCKVIEHLNSTNSGSRASDPVNTVARVLSAHMDTLKWVDQNSALLSQKIDELSRTTDNKQRG